VIHGLHGLRCNHTYSIVTLLGRQIETEAMCTCLWIAPLSISNSTATALLLNSRSQANRQKAYSCHKQVNSLEKLSNKMNLLQVQVFLRIKEMLCMVARRDIKSLNTKILFLKMRNLLGKMSADAASYPLAEPWGLQSPWGTGVVFLCLCWKPKTYE